MEVTDSRTLLLKATAGGNQKFQKTVAQFPSYPNNNILTVPNRTLSCKLQVKFKSNAKKLLSNCRSDTFAKIPKLPEQFSEKISSQFLTEP